MDTTGDAYFYAGVRMMVPIVEDAVEILSALATPVTPGSQPTSPTDSTRRTGFGCGTRAMSGTRPSFAASWSVSARSW